MCIDRYSCLLIQSHKAMNIYCLSNLIASQGVKHWFRRRPSQKPYNIHFDVNVALAQYISRTLFVDFRCSDSKDLIVCLLIQIINIFIFQMQKCSFTFFSMLFINAGLISKHFCMVVLSEVWTLYIHTLFKSWKNFYLKSVNFLFLL